MDNSAVQDIYDSKYAEGYNNRFLFEPGYKNAAEYEVTLLRQLIDEQTEWVDIGCGTGFFLGKFQGVKRAGFDLSPEMLKVAQQENPDALFFRQGDFRNKIPEWNNKWSLVSSMWGAYVYLDSPMEVVAFFHNLMDWTKERGTLFLPIIDHEDCRPSTPISYEEEAYTLDNVSYGKIVIKSFTWDYIEYIGKSHIGLVSLHLNYAVELIAPYFDELEVCYYPLNVEEKVSRKAIIAKGKRKVPDFTNIAKTTWNRPLHNVKTMVTEERRPEAVTIHGVSFYLKRFKPFSRYFWKQVSHFLRH